MSDHTNPLFADRHIGPDSAAVAAMLEVIGVDSLEELARRALPAGILDGLTGSGAAPGLDQLPPAATEAEALAVVDSFRDRHVIGLLTEAYVLRRYAAALERRRRELIGDE